MISITSMNPEFSVNFPSPVPEKEIELAKLRVYHSSPNIRSVAFGGQQPKNHSGVPVRIKPMVPQTGILFRYQLDPTKSNKSIMNFNAE